MRYRFREEIKPKPKSGMAVYQLKPIEKVMEQGRFSKDLLAEALDIYADYLYYGIKAAENFDPKEYTATHPLVYHIFGDGGGNYEHRIMWNILDISYDEMPRPNRVVRRVIKPLMSDIFDFINKYERAAPKRKNPQGSERKIKRENAKFVSYAIEMFKNMLHGVEELDDAL